MKNPAVIVKEFFTDTSRSIAFAVGTSIRGLFQGSFHGKPAFYNTTVTYDFARLLYRNQNPDFKYGAGFIRPIIDLAVEYMGLPHVTSGDDAQDASLNECITDHWGPQLQQVFRDAMRDSKTIVRFRQPQLGNPLFTEADRMHGRIESWPPELVDITFAPDDPDLIERAIFTHYIKFDERTAEEVATGRPPREVEHEVIEIVTPTAYDWYDKTDHRPLESWHSVNHWNFVAAWPVLNEYTADLGGGQSDIEAVMPFIEAFHKVLLDAMTAHKYHSVPKTKITIKNLGSFLQNNYPDVLDPDRPGQIKQGATINWTGREIMFFEPEENAEFVEAKSVLGDSKTLLEFLIDCIAIASETPKWALLKSEGARDNDASVQPFEKKINRKRVMFSETIVMLCKMVLAAQNQTPVTVKVNWHEINTATLASRAQAVQQLIMSFDVATAHKWMADRTVVAILATYFPEISAPDIEIEQAQDNEVPEEPAPAPASETQALPPAKSSNGNGNGSGSKKAAKKAVKQLATTGASRS